MTKRNTLTIILDTIFVVVFNVLFFVNAGGTYTTSLWICYGFMHFSYLMILFIPILESKGKMAHISRLTSYSISLAYFIIEFILIAFVFFFDIFGGTETDLSKLSNFIAYSNLLQNIPIDLVISIVSFFYKVIGETKLVICVQVILTAIYLIGLISNLLVNDEIAKKQMQHDIENDFIKTISAKTKYIESITTDIALKNKISDLYYTIHSSPIKSNSVVTVYENKIQESLENLEILVESDVEAAITKVSEIERFVNARNYMLKTRN